MAITHQYGPAVFELVPMSSLSKLHFDRHPIWSEHYDFDEREEIVDWGIDRRWLEDELERVRDVNEHYAYPILRPYPLPLRMRLYIKARLGTPAGRRLDGYVMNEDAYVVGLFVQDREFTFSRNPSICDLNHAGHERLLRALGSDAEPIFPLEYETDFVDRNDHAIKGTFAIDF